MYKHKETVASLKDVTKDFNHKRILHGISMDIYKNEMLLITGPSGSGKSTSIRILADLEEPTEGEAIMFGTNLQKTNTKKKRELIANRVSYGQQDPALDGGLSVFQNITLSARAIQTERTRDEIRERAGQLAVRLGICHLLERRADKTLSGGERAKVAIGRALVKEPDILLLDEPTGSVDPRGKVDIFETLSEIRHEEDLTIVVVSHDVNEIRPYVDREVIINSGLIVNQG